jgi:hypothetical protein
MDYNEKRFNFIVKLTRIVSSIVFYLMWGLVGLSIIGVIILLLLDPDLFTFNLAEVPSSIDRFDLYGVPILEVLGDQVLSLRFTLFLVSGAALVYGISTIWILLQLRGVLEDVNETRPFSIANAKRLFYITYSILALSVLEPLFSSVIRWSVLRQFDIATRIGLTFSFNFGLLFMAALLYILAHIFQYGAHLQDEVDTTI